MKIKRTEWFTDSRFGMFVHWGLYSILGRGEWVRSEERITIEDYEKYFSSFNPIDYNPRQWAKKAKQAGMKYVVLTAKHHDGFCLFDSKLTDYKATNTPAKRDLIAEFVDAVRSEGLQIGLYYSLIDWHHPHYPKYGDLMHPMRDNEKYINDKIDFDLYLDYMHGQVKELVTNYGKIDILWFDYSYDDMRGEKWRAKELVSMVRKYQPQVIMDNRLETSGAGFGSLITDCPSEFSGDFVSPEQIIPPAGIVNSKNQPVPWELCVTMNNNWGYNPYDTTYKPASLLIRKLVECVSKGGNMILNAGPNARGVFNKETDEILAEIGIWINKNGESIYGCTNANLEKPEWGRYTRRGNTIYAHIFEAPIGPLYLPGIAPESIISVRRLEDDSEVLSGNSWVTEAYSGKAFVTLGKIPFFTYPLADQTDTVLKITVK